jgi:hypothetical protein
MQIHTYMTRDTSILSISLIRALKNDDTSVLSISLFHCAQNNFQGWRGQSYSHFHNDCLCFSEKRKYVDTKRWEQRPNRCVLAPKLRFSSTLGRLWLRLLPGYKQSWLFSHGLTKLITALLLTSPRLLQACFPAQYTTKLRTGKKSACLGKHNRISSLAVPWGLTLLLSDSLALPLASFRSRCIRRILVPALRPPLGWPGPGGTRVSHPYSHELSRAGSPCHYCCSSCSRIGSPVRWYNSLQRCLSIKMGWPARGGSTRFTYGKSVTVFFIHLPGPWTGMGEPVSCFHSATPSSPVTQQKNYDSRPVPQLSLVAQCPNLSETSATVTIASSTLPLKLGSSQLLTDY